MKASLSQTSCQNVSIYRYFDIDFSLTIWAPVSLDKQKLIDGRKSIDKK